MKFSDIPGLSELKSQLVASQQKGKIAHAQLFSGVPGSVALPMARAYASFLMCENKTDQDSCGSCSNCLRLKKNIHPDVHFVFPKVSAPDSGKFDKLMKDAMPLFRSFLESQPYGTLADWAQHYGQDNKNLLISREDSRQMLRNVSMRSVEGGYKVLIVWCPETMHVSAANAILKILEEPPLKTIYLLVTYSYDALLATITSRSQLVTIPLNSDEEIKEYLRSLGLVPTEAERMAYLLDGKMGNAVHIMNHSKVNEFKAFQSWMRACYAGDLQSLIERSEHFFKLGKSGQRPELDYQLNLVRKSLLHTAGSMITSESDEETHFIGKFASRIGSGKLEKIYHLLNDALSHLDRNANAKIIHLNLSLDILQVINAQD